MSIDTRRTTPVEARIAPDVPAQIIHLSMDEQRRFASLLLDPPALAPAMKRAAQAHKKLILSNRA